MSGGCPWGYGPQGHGGPGLELGLCPYWRGGRSMTALIKFLLIWSKVKAVSRVSEA